MEKAWLAHLCLLVLVAGSGCSSSSPAGSEPGAGGTAGDGAGGESSASGGGRAEGGAGGADSQAGGADQGGRGEGGDGDPGVGGLGGDTVIDDTQSTGSDVLPPPAAPFAEAPALRASFDTPDALTKGFVITQGAADVSVKNGTLQIAPGRAGTVLVDSSPASAPGDVFTGDLTIQFRVKGDTTSLVPAQGVNNARSINDAWIALPQGNRASAPRIVFRWSEAGEDSISLRTGTDVANNRTSGTRLGGVIFASPAYSGDTWYTIRVVIKASGNGQANVLAQLLDGPVVALQTQGTFTGLTANGEIAIGGAPGLAGRPSPLLIDDLEVWKKSDAIPGDTNVYHRTTVNGLAAQLWIPPGVTRVNGIFIETPGAGGDTTTTTMRPWYQAFAALHGYAIFGHAVGLDPAGIMRGIDQLATVTNREELKTAPVVVYGFSRGARMIIDMMNSFTTRLITYVGDSAPNTPAPNAAAMKLPGVFIFGQNDTVGDERTALFAVQRRTRTAAGHMAVLEKQGLSHTPSSSYFFFLPYLDKMIRTLHADPSKPPTAAKEEDAWLLASEGWLPSMLGKPAPLVRIEPAASYSGDKVATGWFANKDLAYLGAAYTGFNRALVVSPMQHAVQGDARTVRVRFLPDMAAWKKIELYDFGTLIHTFQPGQPLVFKYENLSPGVHSIAAHMTHGSSTFASFPTMVIVKKR